MSQFGYQASFASVANLGHGNPDFSTLAQSRPSQNQKHPQFIIMPSFSGHQATHLQKYASTNGYAPAPSSGSGLPELSSVVNSRQSESTAQAPQYQQSSTSSVDNTNKSNGNGYNASRSPVSLLSSRANPSIMRSASIDSDAILPRTHNNSNNSNDNDQAPQKPKRTFLRAAESGKGSLLPIRGTPTSVLQQQRQRINRAVPGRSNSSGRLPITQRDLVDSNTKLRRRPTNAASDEEFDFDSSNQRSRKQKFHDRNRSGGMSVSSAGSVSTLNNGSKEHSNAHRRKGSILCQDQLIKLSRMKLGHLLQVVIVLAVVALVYESHNKALFATQQLVHFKEEESLLLLHLQKIEQQSIQLHENFKRLAEIGTGGGKSGDTDLNEDKQGAGNEVDFDLIHKQTEQLKHMEQELSHEVETLQKRIQLSARNHIIKEFGEGPVQVVLDLDLRDDVANSGPHRISILLWHDTPHAAWTWLEQIGNNVWDGAEFKWQQGHIIDAVPRNDRVDLDRDGKIEFVEHSQHEHIAWTVGVREQPNSTNGTGRGPMSMYINLQDNSHIHRHETCVGKVIDGFDALQKLLELSRNNSNNEQEDNHATSLPIFIRKATAEHYVSKRVGMGK